MPTQWQSQAYRHVYEDLVRQMDPSSIRDKCFTRELITQEQRNDLSLLNGAKHNRSLLELLEKHNDDKYEVFCQILLDNAIHLHNDSVAEMRKASDGAAASASTHGQGATSSATSLVEGNPFKTEEYLITSGQVFLLSTTYQPIGRVEHSRELFRLMEAGGPEAIRTSSAEVLPFLGQCARHKADAGKLLAKPVPKALGRAEPRTGTKTQFKERKPNSCTPTGSVEVVGGLLPNHPVYVETPDSQVTSLGPVGGQDGAGLYLMLPGEADAGAKVPRQGTPAVGASSGPAPDQDGARALKTKIGILAVTFDAMMYYGRDSEVGSAWGHLDNYITYLNQRCTNLSVHIKMEHIESKATSAAVQKAVVEVHQKAKDLKDAGYEVIGMMVGAEENRLTFFHAEQSTSFRPVAMALKSESASNGIITVVSSDVPSSKGTLLWRSAEVQLHMEMQLKQKCFDGEKGVVLSWSRSVTSVHARAIAMYALSKSFQPAELLNLQPCPDEINPDLTLALSGSESHTAGFGRQLSEMIEVGEFGWKLALDVGDHILEKLNGGAPGWIRRRNTSKGYQQPSKQKRANFVLVNIGGAGNPEVKFQMENFSRLCIPGTDEDGQASPPRVKTQVARKVNESDIEAYSRWISDTEDWYNVAVLFAAAQDYYEKPEMISQLASIFQRAGFKSCVICALFDHGYWLEDNQEVALSSALGKEIGSELEKCSLPVKVVSWWSRPSLAVAKEVVEVWKVPGVQ